MLPLQSTITLSHPCSLLHSTLLHTLSPLACVFILSPAMITTLILLPVQSTITLSHPCSLPHSTILHTLSPLACVFILSPAMITTLILPGDPSRSPPDRRRESPHLGPLAAASAIQRRGTLRRNRTQERVLRDQESAPVDHQPPGSLPTPRNRACRGASPLTHQPQAPRQTRTLGRPANASAHPTPTNSARRTPRPARGP